MTNTNNQFDYSETFSEKRLIRIQNDKLARLSRKLDEAKRLLEQSKERQKEIEKRLEETHNVTTNTNDADFIKLFVSSFEKLREIIQTAPINTCSKIFSELLHSLTESKQSNPSTDDAQYLEILKKFIALIIEPPKRCKHVAFL